MHGSPEGSRTPRTQSEAVSLEKGWGSGPDRQKGAERRPGRRRREAEEGTHGLMAGGAGGTGRAPRTPGWAGGE